MSNQSVRIRQWVLLASLVIVLVTFAIVVAFFSQDKNPKERTASRTTIHLDQDSFNEEHFVTTFGAKMTSMEKELQALSSQIKREEERQKREAKFKAREEEFNDAFDSTETQLMGSIPTGATPVPGNSVSGQRRSPQQDVPRIVIKKVSDLPNTENPPSTKNDEIAKNRTRERKADDLLLTGSFARARLLNGVEAPTGGQANGNPVPMLLEIKDPAFLPNRYRSDIKRCMVTANATGDLSSERVLVRLDRMSCITHSRGAIDVRVTGYVTGEDGKTGLKARVVTRSGQAIANALLVGTLSGLGEAVSLAAQDSTTNFAGTVTNSVNNPWRAGLGEGMQDALDRVAGYYLKLADKIFPVLEVDAGRDVDIVITQSASIATEKSIF